MFNRVDKSFFISILIIKIIIYIQAEQPRVVTPLGILEGYWSKTVNNNTYAAFTGIPYAKSPIGERRFEEPKEIEPWIGIWKANTEYKCLQYNHYTEPGDDYVIGQEDCLYLNIYTPDVTKKYDVIVFIHGGAFMFNSALSYGPKYILDKEVILVTINYRLGPLGFLSTEDKILPGNNGLKDQLMALKWIKSNIKYFGGDTNSITISGMSAGGASVHLHYISPLSKGLFHRAIAQSGTALNNWVLVENSLEKARKLGNIVGCNYFESNQLIKCLKKRPGRQIVQSVKHFQKWLYNPFSPFGVVIDKCSNNPIIPEHPYKLIKKAQFTNVPLILSCVDAEGLYPGADFARKPEHLENINQNWNDLLPHILDYNYTVSPGKVINEISQKIRDYYFGNKEINFSTYNILIKMMSDRLFKADIGLAAKLQASSTRNAKIFFYYFSYRGAHSKSESWSKSNANLGVSHGDDLAYILSSNVDTKSTVADRKMSEILQNIWLTFASTGTPNLNDIHWLPISKNFSSPLQHAHIQSPALIKMGNVENLGNWKFWNSLGFLENKKLLS